MPYDKQRHHRRSIRLPNYDYRSPGAYFVTICVRDRECVFGEVVNGEMQLNEWGQMAWDCWEAIPEHFPHVELDAFTVMPNHVHGIIIIIDDADAPQNVGAQHAAPLQAPAPLQPGQANVHVGTQDGAPGQTTHTNVHAGTQDDAPIHGTRTNGLVGAQHAAPLRQAPAPLQAGQTNARGRAPDGASVEGTRTNVEPGSLGAIVRSFKAAVTKKINEQRDMPGAKFWQRNYWEHIIRNEVSLNRIRDYIENNAALWAEDQLHPDAPPNPFNRDNR